MLFYLMYTYVILSVCSKLSKLVVYFVSAMYFWRQIQNNFVNFQILRYKVTFLFESYVLINYNLRLNSFTERMFFFSISFFQFVKGRITGRKAQSRFELQSFSSISQLPTTTSYNPLRHRPIFLVSLPKAKVFTLY